jgi:hypothetical protein
MSKRVLPLLTLVLVTLLTPVVAAGPAAAETPVGPLPTPEDFVTQQYEDFLGRPPDTPGLLYWSAQVRNGLDPSALVESLAKSPEFEGTMAPVVRLYYAHFQRPPDYGGMTYWAQVARGGASMEAISQEFVQSHEFQVRYGSLTNEQYINQVYLNVLGRSADPSGLAYWGNQLARGMTRGGLMVAFSDSAEYRKLIGGRVLATMLYVGMLRRAPDTAGLDYWAQVVDGGTPYRNVIGGFLGAHEYSDRMGQIYRHLNPLTGVPTRVNPLRPALAIKVDNVDQARPPTNLEWADLVYEEMVEGQLTRLVAVFHSRIPGVVGPVRSVRTTDIDLLDQFNTPLLAASGANGGVLAAVANADLVNVNALVAGGAYFRDNRRSAPHNMYTRPVQLYEAGTGKGGGMPPQIFQYRIPWTSPQGGVASTGVGISFGRATIDFTWSPEHRGWKRTQNGTAHVTASGKLLAPANVVVLEVPYGVSSIDAESPEAHTVGSGTAHVFTAGQRITGTWSRSQSEDVILIKDGNGDQIPLSRGQTFIELAPPGSVHAR